MRTVLAWGTSWRWVSHQGGYLEVSTIGSRPSLSRKLYSLLGPRAFARWKRSQPQRQGLRPLEEVTAAKTLVVRRMVSTEQAPDITCCDSLLGRLAVGEHEPKEGCA